MAGRLVGIWLAAKFGVRVAVIFGNASWAIIAGYVLVMFLTMLVFSLIGTLLKKAMGAIMLDWLDRLLGGILGLALGAFTCAAVLTIIIDATFTPPGLSEITLPDPSFIQRAILDSKLAEPLMRQFPLLLALIPGEMGDKVRLFFS